MKKILLATIVLGLLMSFQGCFIGVDPNSNGYYGGDAGYEPPPIGFEQPPEVIAIPYARDVYAVPDISVDLFFWDGWWWRPWNDQWYRSHNYNGGWARYDSVPGFYRDVDPGWRGNYRNRSWQGHRWNYERIPNHQLQQNWKNWHNNNYWEKEKSWGVQGLRPGQQRPDDQPRFDNKQLRPVDPPRYDVKQPRPADPPRYDVKQKRPEDQLKREVKKPRPEDQPKQNVKKQHPEDKVTKGSKSDSQNKQQAKDIKQKEKRERKEQENKDILR
ncbi:MAG: hypothetical protein A4E72_00105 [Syntrophus sp. PtaU1.Bin208]|nr:MAG: hypothetical protein A4E72_00105 [Syntrophus sp. PtaU1.Bin208]